MVAHVSDEDDVRKLGWGPPEEERATLPTPLCHLDLTWMGAGANSEVFLFVGLDSSCCDFFPSKLGTTKGKDSSRARRYW